MLLESIHTLLQQAIHPGDAAVDATVGNGRDTLALARAVGDEGLVCGFDVQEAALARARTRLDREGVSPRVRLLHAGHETLAERLPGELPAPLRERVRAVTFNLGFHPGGDRSIITRPESTLPALDAALNLLAPGGLLSVVAYAGHPGGEAEREAVAAWIDDLHESRLLRLEDPARPAITAWLIRVADASGVR